MIEEIPEDLVQTARDVAGQEQFRLAGMFGGAFLDDGTITVIAQALLAERERCAKIAEKETDGPSYEGNQMWRDGYETAARTIAAAIRSKAQ